MGDKMRPVPFCELLSRIFGEFKTEKSIFGINEYSFFKKKNDHQIQVFGESCDLPIGPAAGPHTQLAQNIITSYLVGGRFFELKTVQILDRLEIKKPCIDSADECYNSEWSTEFTLEKAYDEYLKAWVLLHFLEKIFQLGCSNKRSFVYNMSVGYDLAGIKSERVDSFLNHMKDANLNQKFDQYLNELDNFILSSNLLDEKIKDNFSQNIDAFLDSISANICNQITISTMHGCPPDEIEAICSYLLKTKNLNTYLKLNPTLLGFKQVRSILNRLGFGYVDIRQETFDKDPAYDDAILMLKNLIKIAKDKNKYFGVKLTNTLGTINNKDFLDSREMYMSGRSLFPLSINLAAKIASQFNGQLPISYAGGANNFNITQIYQTGIKPITIATDLLKPGGYLRLKNMAEKIESIIDESPDIIDKDFLYLLAQNSLDYSYTQKNWKQSNVRVDKKLPLFDCFIAPCSLACPICQDIPEYITLISQKKFDKALELIYSKNPLPSITGTICDHKCMENCTRIDYEDAVKIRDLKLIAVKNGWKKFRSTWQKPDVKLNIKVAIIGAGPAGLSAAYFLLQHGFRVTVFEKQKNPGGIVENVIPEFRIGKDAISQDVKFIQDHGAQIIFNYNVDVNIQSLEVFGYKYIIFAIGAQKEPLIEISGDNKNIISSMNFLKNFKVDQSNLNLGKNVVVVGGGNTALDSARAALKLDSTKTVTIVYRRSLDQMPAAYEEYFEAKEEGINFKFLLNPEKFNSDGSLFCRIMKLGDIDSSGRQKPVATDKTITIKADSLITAIGQKLDSKIMLDCGIIANQDQWPEVNADSLETKIKNVYLIGDALKGPSTIVSCISDAKKASNDICQKEQIQLENKIILSNHIDIKEINLKKGRLINAFDIKSNNIDLVTGEANRCLECHKICLKCVEVCPNRANIAIKMEKKDNFADMFNIIHIDAFCNECGNCGHFCPFGGLPYKDKLTLYNLRNDFDNSTNNGFIIEDNDISVRLNKNKFNLKSKNNKLMPISSDLKNDVLNNDVLNKVCIIINKIIEEYSYLLGKVKL